MTNDHNGKERVGCANLVLVSPKERPTKYKDKTKTQIKLLRTKYPIQEKANMGLCWAVGPIWKALLFEVKNPALTTPQRLWLSGIQA